MPVEDAAGVTADRLHANDEVLLQQIFSFVRYLIGECELSHTEIPKAAFAAASFRYYYRQVLNGGHSQFVGNAGALALPVLDHAVWLLGSSGQAEYALIAGQARAWILANPHEAAKQTGFSGGIAPELRALDERLLAQNNVQSPVPAVAARLRQKMGLKPSDSGSEYGLHFVRTDAIDNLLSGYPHTRKQIARNVSSQVRAWFANPLNVGLGLAAGWHNGGGFIDARLLQPQVSGVNQASGAVAVTDILGDPDEPIFCNYTLSADGLSLRPLRSGPSEYAVDVPAAAIERVQRLALEFRIPESIGLRWWWMARPFLLDRWSLYEHPRWEPGKFWLRLTTTRWAVKGSPEKSTFVRLETEEKESLLQGELAKRSVDAGISPS